MSIENDKKFEDFLDEIKQFTHMKSSIQNMDKAVILFTAAVEIGTEEVGFSSTLDLLRQLMAIASDKELGTPYLWSGKDDTVLH